MEKASFIASIAVCLFSWTVVPTGIFGVVTNKATTRPKIRKKMKNNIVVCHPASIKEYLTIKGDTKYPNDPAEVTIPVAIVLFDKGKCLATTATGMLIAVDAKPTPINIPKVNVK